MIRWLKFCCTTLLVAQSCAEPADTASTEAAGITRTIDCELSVVCYESTNGLSCFVTTNVRDLLCPE